MIKKWRDRFLQLADVVASWSQDDQRKVGTVVVDKSNSVVSVGYNGLPRGISHDIESRHVYPDKAFFYEHSERNAIYNAARKVLEGTTLITTYLPCADCARGIVQSGISVLIVKNGIEAFEKESKWTQSVNAGLEILFEARVSVYVDRGKWLDKL